MADEISGLAAMVRANTDGHRPGNPVLITFSFNITQIPREFIRKTMDYVVIFLNPFISWENSDAPQK